MIFLRRLFLVALFLAFLTAAIPASANSDHEFVAREIERLVPAIQKIDRDYEREKVLWPMATALARLGNFEAALRITDSLAKDEWRQNPRDEIWRITARRLAWQGNIAAATRCAHRIEGEYSRADALLAVARAYIRESDSAAARRLLNQVRPLLEKAESPLAVGYLGYLFARTGDTRAARELFAKAKTVEDSSTRDLPEGINWPDQRWASIAYWQAKLGWTDEALETARSGRNGMDVVQAVLVQRRDWPQLTRLATDMPPVPAASSLSGLALRQFAAGDRDAASATVVLMDAAIARIDRAELTTPRNSIGPVMSALLKVLLGDESKGRAEFAELSKQPHFTDELELVFHLFLSNPFQRRLHEPVFAVKPSLADEEAAIAILLRMGSNRGFFHNFLEIARAQQKRGDMPAMNKTLQVARQQLRDDLAAPKNDNNSLESRRMNTTSALISIAQIERDAGLSLQAQNTLAQAKTMAAGRPPKEFVPSLLRAEFYDEAALLLHQLAPKTGSAELNSSTNNMYHSAFQMEAALHAKARGVPAAMSWISKIDNAPVRAVTLSTMAVALTPIPADERELILGGNKKVGATVGSRIAIPGYGSSYNFDEDHF